MLARNSVMVSPTKEEIERVIKLVDIVQKTEDIKCSISHALLFALTHCRLVYS